MTTLETILVIALVAVWLMVAVSLLISTVQGIRYERKREKREEESERRDREYHSKRMECELEQIRRGSEYQAKRMENL